MCKIPKYFDHDCRRILNFLPTFFNHDSSFRKKLYFGPKRMSRIPHNGYKNLSNLGILLLRYQVLLCLQRIIPVLKPAEFPKYFDHDCLKIFNLLCMSLITTHVSVKSLLWFYFALAQKKEVKDVT